MPRKTPVNELQSEQEVSIDSPVRRSTRILNNNVTPAGSNSRRQTQGVDLDVPAKATRSRRTSTQTDDEEDSASKKTSTLDAKESQQAAAKRGRKLSNASEASDKEEIDKPKALRTRRNSRTASEENEKPQTKPVRARRSSATIETEKTTAPSTPSRRTRRSGSAESDAAGGVVPKPATRVSTRRSSVTEETVSHAEEATKPAVRRGRRSSTGSEPAVNTPSKTPTRRTRRNSESKADFDRNEPIVADIKEFSVNLTPLRKKKLIDKVEAELDLSVINESSGDLNVSENSFKEGEKETSKLDSLFTNTRKRPSAGGDDEASSIKSPRLSSGALTPIVNSTLKSSKELIATGDEEELNTSKACNKENLYANSDQLTKDFRKEVAPPCLPFAAARVSNVFKPNQKECSFIVEPMEVDVSVDISAIAADNSHFEKMSALSGNSVLAGNVPRKHLVEEADSTMIGCTQLSSSIFNKSITSSSQMEQSSSEVLQNEAVNTVDENLKINYSDAEESGAVVFEETENSVDFSFQPKARISESVNPDSSLIINKKVETVKVNLNEKTSSPISDCPRRYPRKSTSPAMEVNTSSESEKEDVGKLGVAKFRRRTKSKSKTPSPSRRSRASSLSPIIPRVAKSQTPDKRSKSPLETLKLNTQSKSPSCVGSNDLQDNTKPAGSKELSPIKLSNVHVQVTSEERPIQPAQSSNIGEVLCDAVTPNACLDVKATSRSRSRSPNVKVNQENKLLVTPKGGAPSKEKESSVRASPVEELTPEISKDIEKTTNSSAKKRSYRNVNVDAADSSETGNEELMACTETPKKSASLLEHTSSVTPAETGINISDTNDTADLQDVVTESLNTSTNHQSSIEKDLEATHYEFELPSDEEANNTNSGTVDLNLSETSKGNINTEEDIEEPKDEGLNTGEKSNEALSLEEETVDLNLRPTEQTSKVNVEMEDDKVEGLNTGEESDEALGVEEETEDTNNEATESVNGNDKETSSRAAASDKSEITLESRSPESEHQLSKGSLSNRSIEIPDLGESIADDISRSKSKKRVSAERVEEIPDVAESVEDSVNKLKKKKKRASTEKAERDSTKKRRSLEGKTKNNSELRVVTSKLDLFASAKLNEYLEAQALNIESSSDEEEGAEEESESEQEYNDFIDGIAEEGEEDTPSEDSNDITEVGESIGSEDSDKNDSDEDSYSNDSFICDDEKVELLPGDEYDLGNEKEPAKKSQEDDTSKPRKLSRIISLAEFQARRSRNSGSASVKIELSSSSEDESTTTSQKSILQTHISKETKAEDEAASEQEDSIIVIEDSSQEGETVNVLKVTNNDANTSEVPNLRNSFQNPSRRTSLSLQESIVVDGMKDPKISQRINTLVESFCSTVKRGEISLNLSLEYEDSTEQNAKAESVHIVSDLKLCQPGGSGVTEDSCVDKVDKVQSEESSPKDRSVDKVDEVQSEGNYYTSENCETKREKRRLKRRLSKSLSEVFEDSKNAKRRKKNAKTKANRVDSGMEPRDSFNLMSQLITDVKNRPRRTIQPSTSSGATSTWAVTVAADLKPSTSEEMSRAMSKLHPKDFKTRLLTDPKRNRRVGTKTLLKQKGAFF